MDEQVNKEEAENYAKSINGFYRCVSALDANSGGISELFESVGKGLFQNKEREENANENIKIDKKDITDDENQKEKGNKKKGGCC